MWIIVEIIGGATLALAAMAAVAKVVKAEAVKAEAVKVEAVAETPAVVKAMAAMAAARPVCASGGCGCACVRACVCGRAGEWVGARMRACMSCVHVCVEGRGEG